jgi:hypothetical protein
MTPARLRFCAALLGCSVAVGCAPDRLTLGAEPLAAEVYGRVYAPDGAPAAAASVDVETWRDADVRPYATATVVADADGWYDATLHARGAGTVRSTAVVRAHPPVGVVAADGVVRGTVLYFVRDTPGTSDRVRVDVTLGASIGAP